ncbi:MAG TPA: cyclic nucleotide-binding domain-containing protein [Thermoanaerobaculia bacterium]|jgi:CRP-like cAMP-binding protein/Tfp pilus assembly protein PilF|nr:cyclic nucleotide-binding domain-containing protein [Thermoanaerobaculia bacterium]
MSDLQSSPSNREVQELTDLARRFSESGRHEEAADLLLLALRLDPKNLSVKLGLAEVRKRHQQLQGGSSRSLRDLLREGYRRNAIDAAHFLGLAHLYADKGENVRAIDCIEVAKAKDLANPANHKLHARLLFRRRDFDGAAEEFSRALRYNPFDRETAESLGRSEYERKQFEAALGATVHAFLLLNDGDEEGVRRLRRRIQTLKQILGWGNRELSRLFRERQEIVHTAFDRLEWHRERFLEQGGLPGANLSLTAAPPARREAGGQIELAARLRRLKPLAHFSDEQIFRLTQAVREEIHDVGNLIFAHRSQGRDLYVLERGEVNLQRTTTYGTFDLGVVDSGELFGEAGFLTAHERNCDALVASASQVLRLEAAVMDNLVETSAEMGVQVYWTLWHSLARKLRATNDQLKTFFSDESLPESFLRLRKQPAGAAASVKVEPSDKIRLFREQGLSRRELMTLATFSKEKRFAAGAYLFQEGDEGSEMYVVLEGRVVISKFIPGAGEEALAVLERGDFFGEMSLIDGEPRSADAKAHGGPLTVLALDQGTVREILAMDPHAALEFLQLLCRLVAGRLREIDEKVIGWRIMSGERNESVSA